MRVGYLSREDAAEYRPGLLAFQARQGRSIALLGVIVGGGMRADGPGRLGVWLSCNPHDFGVAIVAPPVPATIQATIRTGLSEALAADEQDDSYDLSWLEQLPVTTSRKSEGSACYWITIPTPSTVTTCSASSSGVCTARGTPSPPALDEYDETCRRHDTEMDGIRNALLAKFREDTAAGNLHADGHPPAVFLAVLDRGQ